MLRTLRLADFLEELRTRTDGNVELCLIEMTPEEKRTVEAEKGGITMIQRRAIVSIDGERHQEFDDLLNRLP